MTTYYKYRIKCTTDNTYEYRILASSQPIPTTCPTNTAHTVDTSLTSIVDTIEDNFVTIKEESVATGGNFTATTLVVNALKNQTTSSSISFPFPISALSVDFISDSSHVGDVVELVVGKDTIIGAIVANVAPASAWVTQNYTVGQVVTYNSNVYTCIQNTISNEAPTNAVYWQYGLEISVSQTVIDNTSVGYYINLFDGVNIDTVNRITKIDSNNNKIYVETNLINSFSAVSPTYVRQSVYTIRNYTIGPAWEHSIGDSKIGGSYIPANIAVSICYENKSVDTDKTFIGRVEYLY